MKERGIGATVYYGRPHHLQPVFAHLGYREGSLPETERAAREAIALPMFPTLSEQQQEEVVAARPQLRRARLTRSTARRSVRAVDARLDRPHQQPARPAVRAGRPRPRGARRRGAGDRAPASRRPSSSPSCTASTSRSSARTAAARGSARAAPRPAACRRSPAGPATRGPDVALAHGSTDMPIVARALRIRATTMLDYEQSLLQQSVCCRFAHRVLVPEVDPAWTACGGSARGRARSCAIPGSRRSTRSRPSSPIPALPADARRAARRDPRRAAPAAGARPLPPHGEPAVRRRAAPPRRPTRTSTRSCCRATRRRASPSARSAWSG